MSRIREILEKLKEPFPPEAHKERELPGGGAWFFVPWQRIRERLDEVCPEWEVEYGTPQFLDKYCMVSCTLTIPYGTQPTDRVSRQAWGNAEIELLSKSGRDMSRGTPIERAVADALKNCAESFGVAAYLDEQSQDKREFTLRYLHSKGDSRGLQLARENNWVPGNLPSTEEKRVKAAAESASRRVKASPITDAQQKRFWAIARNDGGYSNEGVGKLLETYQITQTKDVTSDIYNELCKKAADQELAEIYNRSAATIASLDW